MSETRKIAAILVADVVGYSRLAGADEDRTLARLRALRSDLIDPTIAVHHGRVVKRTGDGTLIEFRSVVDAVRCAIEVQNGMVERNAGLPTERRIEFRIGIHLGDVVEESDGDLMGDGVNIAARLEGIAQPGSICLSNAAYEQVRDKVKEQYADLGEQVLKNIERPVRVYSLASSAINPSTAPLAETREPSADQPSIAVLPFTCFSEEREFKFLTEAMTEDLITMLARIPGFIVIARQSSFAYQGRSVDSRQIGRELGVHYIIEGSLRPVGQQLRVGTQLIDATTGIQLWADRFDGQAENVLELQDQIARAIASRIEPELVRAEVALIRRRRDANPNAWSCFRQGAGVISLKGWSEETLTQATALLRQATTLDPDFALARAQLALFLSLGARLGLVADGAAAVTEARAEAERAVTIDHDASEVLGYAGCALAELGDVQRGSEILERAIENDPSNAQAWVALGTSLCFLEKSGDVGLDKLRHGMRLSPRDHRLGFWGTFYALALARHRRLTEAHEEVRAACRRDPQFYVARIVLAFTAAGLGSKEEAIAALREAQRLRPRLSLDEIQLFVGRRGAALLAPLWREVPKSSQ
ncbi:adenylate cyclase [Rhizobiales bacterium GAS191]|nr:adenylate cyclase [Rhizobiales bacterium GAS191]